MKKRFEAEFVDQFTTLLELEPTPFLCKSTAIEFTHPSGRVDVLALLENGELAGFEAKLSNWKGALDQAFRNTSFCHYSYVVLPKGLAIRALQHKSEFQRRRVGIYSLENDVIKLVLLAEKQTPILPWLTKVAEAYLMDNVRIESAIAECS